MPASTNVGPSKPKAPAPISDAASGGGYAPAPAPKGPKAKYYTTKAEANASGHGTLGFATGKGYYLRPNGPGAPKGAPTPTQAAAGAAASTSSSLEQYLSYLQTNMGRNAQDMIDQEIAGIQQGYLAQQKQGSQAIVGDTQTYVNELGKIGQQADSAYTTAEGQQSALDTAIGSALQTGDVGASASKLTQALAAAGQNTAPGAAAQAAASQTGSSMYASSSASLSQLFAQGAAQKAYDATLPGIAKAQGLGALGAFNASLTDAEKTAVTAAQDKLPALMNAFNAQAKTQVAAAAEAYKESRPQIYGGQSSGYFALLADGTNVPLSAPGAPKPIVRLDGQGGLVKVDPVTGTVTQVTGDRPPKPPKPPAGKTKTVNGVTYYSQDGGKTWSKTNLPVGKGKGGSGGSGDLTANEAQSYVRSLVKEPTAAQSAKGATATYTTDYSTAYKHLRQSGIADQEARTLLDSYYKRGTGGRAWLTNEEQSVLKKAAAARGQGGFAGLQGSQKKDITVVNIDPKSKVRFLSPIQYQILKGAGKLPPGAFRNNPLGKRYYIAQ